MKAVIAVLVILLIVLQYKLWFADGGINRYMHLQRTVAELEIKNKNLSERNAVLLAEVKDLKSGHAAIEESARNDLGMVKKGEVFYHIVEKPNKK